MQPTDEQYNQLVQDMKEILSTDDVFSEAERRLITKAIGAAVEWMAAQIN